MVSGQFHVRKTLMSTFPPLRTDEMSRETEGSSESSITPGKIQYKLIEYVEDLDRYCPGGYHPLKIGDKLDEGR